MSQIKGDDVWNIQGKKFGLSKRNHRDRSYKWHSNIESRKVHTENSCNFAFLNELESGHSHEMNNAGYNCRLSKYPERKSDHDKVPCREVIGTLMYISGKCHKRRYSICCKQDSQISRESQDTTLKAVMRIIRYLHRTIDQTLIMKNLKTPLKAYTDSDWATDTEDRKS